MLNKNSLEMKTEVETFVIEETAELIYDDEQLAKWNEHVELLGLEGQKQIVKPTKSPIPFMHLKQGMVEMFKVLCPRIVNLKEYNITPVPVEILDLCALSVREGYFDALQIWYDDKTPDPVCVGVKHKYYCDNGHGGYKYFDSKADGENYIKETGSDIKLMPRTWDATYYLIGKWADVKRSFAELKEMAKTRYITEKSAEFKKQIKEAQAKLSTIEEDAVALFS